jgi:hypothetical protein
MRAQTIVLSFAVSLSAFATTIPADLEARAAELRRQASPQMLAWAHDQGVALARAHGPVDLGAFEQAIRSQFVAKSSPLAKSAPTQGNATYPNLGNLGDGDVMALCFIVLMEASKSAQDDLKAIMDGVKLINKQKDGLRSVEDTVNKLDASLASNALRATPTPVPDRLALLVAAARNIHGRTQGANLSMLAKR